MTALPSYLDRWQSNAAESAKANVHELTGYRVRLRAGQRLVALCDGNRVLQVVPASDDPLVDIAQVGVEWCARQRAQTEPAEA